MEEEAKWEPRSIDLFIWRGGGKGRMCHPCIHLSEEEEEEEEEEANITRRQPSKTGNAHLSHHASHLNPI